MGDTKFSVILRKKTGHLISAERLDLVKIKKKKKRRREPAE